MYFKEWVGTRKCVVTNEIEFVFILKMVALLHLKISLC